jgi:hypothetical protein
MDTCAVETGLLKKKPCGQPAVTHCANCEMAICSKHAIAQFAGGRKTGKFMCKECDAARKQYEKTVPASEPAAEKKPAAAPAGAAPAAAKPGAAPAAAPAAAAKPKEAPKEEAKHDDDAPLEFTPSKKPEEKK